MNKDLKNIVKTIKKANRIALFTHISPDCDALGSVFGLYYALKTLNKTVSIFCKDEFTEVEKLLFEEEYINHDDCNKDDYDLFISCDSPATFRLGAYEEVFKDKDNTIVLDHHFNSGLIGKYNYIDIERSSCCEIVYSLLKALKIKITPTIANKLYTGLSTDTGSFINSNANVNSFQVALELAKHGAETSKLNEILYRTQTKKEIRFKKYLWTNFKIEDDCAYCLLTNKDLLKLKGQKSDSNNYSSSLISIQGVNYSFSIVEEKEGLYSVSMRSKLGFDVRSKAELLGGGGHICAAGAKIECESMEDAFMRVMKAIKGNEWNLTE